MKIYFFSLIILIFIFSSCKKFDSDPNSQDYQELELKTYLDIMDSLLTYNFDEHKNEIPVFIIYDSLLSPTEFEQVFPPYGPYSDTNVNSRFFNAGNFTELNKRVFLPYKDYHLGEGNALGAHHRVDSVTKVINANIKKGQWFTGDWIYLSRICYNEDFTRGYFYFSTYRGPLDAKDFIFAVEKINGKWRICYRDMYGIS